MRTRRRLLALAFLNLAAGGLVTGCGWIFGSPFAPGTYVGDLPCTLSLVDPPGSEGQQEFTTAITLSIAADGRFSVNGVELVVGAQVLRSTPTADLAFEITKITRQWGVVEVEYAPRPTLVGITVEGELVETYRWHTGSILAASHTDLLVTDVSGTTAFTVNCEGVLTPQ